MSSKQNDFERHTTDHRHDKPLYIRCFKQTLPVYICDIFNAVCNMWHISTLSKCDAILL